MALKTIQEALSSMSASSATNIQNPNGTGNPGPVEPSMNQTQRDNAAANRATSAIKECDTTPVSKKVTKAISESSDLISALECVGAMYGIPATNIICDDSAQSIRVVNDNIIAPALPNPTKQTTAIVQAIGGVLDYISQRIDDKVNEIQYNNVQAGHIEDSIKNANPNKGKCIGRYEDDEGGEILVYDTGLVDSNGSEASARKIAELRASDQIPSTEVSNEPPSYFSDEDDITQDVDMNAPQEEDPDADTYDMAEEIQESAYHFNMYSKYHNTRHLGYDMLTKHGFRFIKPMDAVIMEAETAEKINEKKAVKIADIKHLKFDNKGIVDAVKYMNKARADQSSEKGKMDIQKFINNENYKKAIASLNKQFDANINVRFFKTRSENVYTSIYNDIASNLSISKTKGFQLNGAAISIFVDGHYFESSAPEDPELFGQNTVSTILHEIFHNISNLMRKENAKRDISLAMTMNAAAAAKTPKDRRIVITNYVNTLGVLSKNKVIDKIAKKKLIKQLTTLATMQSENMFVQDKELGKKKNDKLSDAEKKDKYIDDLIKSYKKANKAFKPGFKRPGFYISTAALATIAFLINPVNGMLSAGAVAAMLVSVEGLWDLSYFKLTRDYKHSNYMEEYYCDLFAAMYKLPKYFFINDKRKITANEVDEKKLQELVSLEKEFHEATFSTYPTCSERSHAAVKIARNLLKTDDLEPEFKKYCEWIIDNFSNLSDKTNINEIYNETTFDPEEAEDLDKHLGDLIEKNNIVLTESFKEWFGTVSTPMIFLS